MAGGTVTGGTHGIGLYGGSGNSASVSGGTVSGGTAGIGLYYGTSNSVSVAGGLVNGVYGIYVSGGTNTVNVAGGLVSGGSDGIYVSGGTNTVNVSGGTVIGVTITGDSNALNVYSGGTVDLVAGDSLEGTTTDSGFIGLTGSSGTYTIDDLVLSGGTVAFAAGATAARTLALTTLSGTTGTFSLYSNRTEDYGDLITVSGTASGSYSLYVTDTGRTASDLHATYEVVDLASGSGATFSGYGDIGAYRYAVASGLSLSSTYSGLNSEDYYLYNTFAPSAASRAVMGLTADNTVVWYGEMNEIKKRMGDLRMGKQSSDDFWARTYADKYSVQPGGGYAYSQLVRGAEIGKDNPQAFKGGKKYTGFVLGAGKAENTYSAGGSGTTDSKYAGAYASWLKDDGSYVDVIGKYNWFSHRFQTASDSGSYDNRGLGLSAEIGKRFDKGNGVYLQPEAELASLWAGSASYTTTNGMTVESPSTRSLQLRLGVTAGRTWQDGDGAKRQFYGKVSWVNEFAGDSTVSVDSAAFDSSLKGHQWVTGLGFVEDAGHYQLYMDVEKSWGNTVSKKWGVNLGYRWKL
jgi:outer membrane autotransporter barrel domain